jgi:hypothetical protein
LSVEQDLLVFAGILVAIAVLTIVAGLVLLRRAPRQPFFLIRQQTAAAGWRLLIVAVAILVLAGTVRLFGAPVVFQVITPTPSITQTPSITLTPTITFTPSRTLPPTITLTASDTFTPTSSPTPLVPFNIQQQFTSNVTPDPKLAVHPLAFSLSITTDFQPVIPTVVFTNSPFAPIQKIFVTFNYENVNAGVEWTALWFRDGSLAYWESHPWNGPLSGKGMVVWNNAPNYFTHATYIVEIFTGGVWKQSGEFNVVGAGPIATATLSPTITRLPSQTATPSMGTTPTAILAIAPTATK